jgi:hypothetical protein
MIIFSEKNNLVRIQEDIPVFDAFENDLNQIYTTLKEAYKEQDPIETVNQFITIAGTDNEAEKRIDSLHRFTIAILISELLFEGIT